MRYTFLGKPSLFLTIFACIGVFATCALSCSSDKPTETPKPSSGTISASKVEDEQKEIIRNPQWAVAIEKAGLPNLHKINDRLYRGAQPTAEGFKQLKEMGIRTILNLRRYHSDKDEITEANLGGDFFEYVPQPVNAWGVDEKNVVEFLKIVTNPQKQPVFFHCLHGADRTGTMAASYRFVIDGWTAEEALDEMKNGGFNFHSIWENLIRFIKSIDKEKIKSQL
ncbi:MAG: dual specificity protein phosphatase family protein [Deltaproteobacteria bacterium]|nr:dual specificity protein phosphatase family protein [Deltaproteobacteria bacterium]